MFWAFEFSVSRIFYIHFLVVLFEDFIAIMRNLPFSLSLSYESLLLSFVHHES